ncbi:MAG: SPFH domain-containing protein [Promethearchaeota archaeon]|jgi:regulator of protease activity HflC (stomatin/prohibitin superfamily)
MTGGQKWLMLGAASALVLIITFGVLVEIHTVHGNEMAVLETWTGGVDDNVYPPKTYIRFPGFMYTFYNYDMSSQVYVMNDLPSSEEFAQGREKDSYGVQSMEGQDMQISMNARWRLDPDKLVHLHKTVRENFEEKVLRPALLRNVKDKSTVMEAIAAYSGEGLVRLQTNIQGVLTDPEGDVRGKGIIVDNYVIEGIKLDDEYIGQIKARQVAIQAELRAQQEEQAALAEAQKAKAEAQVDYERQVVAAERDKQVGILAAEKTKQERVLAAEADKQEQVLAAEGEKEAGVLRAQAIVAIGEAEARAKEVQLMAYAVDGADNFVTIQVAESMARAFQNIDGYLPGDMNITMLSNSFVNSLRSVMGGQPLEMEASTASRFGGN